MDKTAVIRLSKEFYQKQFSCVLTPEHRAFSTHLVNLQWVIRLIFDKGAKDAKQTLCRYHFNRTKAGREV